MEEQVAILKNEDYSFRELNGGIAILDYTGKSTDIVIPDNINDKPVKYILREAFDNKGLKAVVLPKFLEYIDEDAFYKNEIKELVIPSKVKEIRGGAFGRNKIEKLVIEASITTIHMFCFVGNALTSIDLPESVTTLYNDCFAENDFEELTIPEHITTLGSDSFKDSKKLKKVILPQKLEGSITGAFRGSDIDNIDFVLYQLVLIRANKKTSGFKELIKLVFCFKI